MILGDIQKLSEMPCFNYHSHQNQRWKRLSLTWSTASSLFPRNAEPLFLVLTAIVLLGLIEFYTFHHVFCCCINACVIREIMVDGLK